MSRVILVCGESLIDVISRVDEPVVEVVGGGPLNTAIAASRLGATVTLLCPTSTDNRGHVIRQTLAESAVALLPNRVTELPTAVAHAHIDAHGHASYDFDLLGTALTDISATDSVDALQRQPSAVHVGTLALALPHFAQTTCALLSAAPGAALVMVDPNCRPTFLDGNVEFQSTWHQALARADVIKVSDDDIRYLYGDDVDAGVAQLQQQTNAVILLTLGAAGVDVFAPGSRARVAAPQITVADTVGAGDTFSGAFLAGCAENGWRPGASPDLLLDAVEFAAVAAALVCTRVGAVPPTRAEVDAFISALP